VLDADARREFQNIPLHSAAEVSRFSISRQSRRLMETHDRTQSDFIDNTGPLMRLGLIQALVRMSLQHNISHWCAVMEQSLLRMLAAMAIRFVPIGPAVEYHGLRQPCFCVLPKMLADVRRERPAFWSVLTSGGALAV
jgi:N-acyl amino acid synthase of PEP-CTERM/exosortase system